MALYFNDYRRLNRPSFPKLFQPGDKLPTPAFKYSETRFDPTPVGVLLEDSEERIPGGTIIIKQLHSCVDPSSNETCRCRLSQFILHEQPRVERILSLSAQLGRVHYFDPGITRCSDGTASNDTASLDLALGYRASEIGLLHVRDGLTG